MANREYEIRAATPSRFSLKDLSHCHKIVKAADAVDPAAAAREIPRATTLALALTRNLIVGVGAIKRKRPEYACQIAKSSGVSLDPYTSELGYNRC
jgi:hypothetical protein